MRPSIKSIGTIAGIIILIYLVASISIGSFNPFKWFLRGKISLRPTLTELARTVEIEELITTEYFGEVLTSLDEVYEELELNIPTFYQNLHQLLQDSTALDSVQLSKYKESLEYHYIHQILKPKDVDKYIGQNPFGTFVAERHFARLQAKLRNIRANNKLVYLARGKVRASFDMSKIINKVVGEYKNDTLYVSLGKIQPEILSAINPWFIYPRDEDKFKGIFGYEVIKEDDVESDFEYIRQVRLHAEKKLMDLTIQQGIVERATDSLKNTLTWLLSLVYEHDRIVIEVDT